MQINIHQFKIPELVKYFGYILFVVLLWLNGCSISKSEPKIITVEVPAKVGKFDPKIPVSVPVFNNPIYIKGDIIEKQNPINIKLLAENEILKDNFRKSDSVNKLLQYENSIQINKFSTTFEDDNLTLTIDGVVRGEVKEITPSYTIKQQKADVLIADKLPGLRVLGGIEVGNTKILDDLSFKGSVLFQNRKGNIISAGYDTDNKIWLGYYRSIF